MKDFIKFLALCVLILSPMVATLIIFCWNIGWGMLSLLIAVPLTAIIMAVAYVRYEEK